MNTLHVASDPISHTIEHGHRMENLSCMDESELYAQNVTRGLRRAAAEQRFAATGTLDEDEVPLPSENYLG